MYHCSLCFHGMHAAGATSERDIQESLQIYKSFSRKSGTLDLKAFKQAVRRACQLRGRSRSGLIATAKLLANSQTGSSQAGNETRGMWLDVFTSIDNTEPDPTTHSATMHSMTQHSIAASQHGDAGAAGTSAVNDTSNHGENSLYRVPTSHSLSACPTPRAPTSVSVHSPRTASPLGSRRSGSSPALSTLVSRSRELKTHLLQHRAPGLPSSAPMAIQSQGQVSHVVPGPLSTATSEDTGVTGGTATMQLMVVQLQQDLAQQSAALRALEGMVARERSASDKVSMVGIVCGVTACHA
jgi:hypothetical protein